MKLNVNCDIMEGGKVKLLKVYFVIMNMMLGLLVTAAACKSLIAWTTLMPFKMHFDDIIMIIMLLQVNFLLLSFYGTFIARVECMTHLRFYLFAMIAAFIVQLLSWTFVIFHQDYAIEETTSKFITLWNNKSSTCAVDAIQSQFHCCGDKSALDYVYRLPSSCCEGNPTYCGYDKSFNDGCSKVIAESTGTWLQEFLAISILIVFFQVICYIVGTLFLRLLQSAELKPELEKGLITRY